MPAAGKEKVKADIIAALQAYVDALSAGEPAEGAKMIEAIVSADDVSSATIVDVMAWKSDLGNPGGEGLADALVAAASGLPTDDPVALRAAIDPVLAGADLRPPSARRIPDRGLVQGPGGDRATDEEIEAADFSVVAVIGADNWWVVLDLEPADILLEEG
jgi:hypothetical protein